MDKRVYSRGKQLPVRASAIDLYTILGDQISRKGWPDYHAKTDSGRFIAIEVRARMGRGVKSYTYGVMYELTKAGVDCYLWVRGEGFHQIQKDGGIKKVTEDEALA